jgi:TonB family protein
VLAEIEQTEMAAEQAPPEKSEATTPNLPAPAASPKTSQEDRAQKQTKSQPDGEMFAPVFSSYQQRQKPRGALVALFGLVLVAGAFYGLWTYQPGFREIAQPLVQTYIQPLIDRALALAGIAKPAPSEPQAVATPVKPPAPPVAATPMATTPAPGTVDGAASSPAPDSTTNSAANATATASSPAAPSASPAATTAQSVPAPSTSNPPTAPVTNTAAAAMPNNKSAATKPDSTKSPDTKKDSTVTSASETPLPGESSAIILSSKGAEKRLAHSVAPKFPASARSASADATIVLKEVVDAAGKVEGVRLVEGDSTLAAAAMKAVKQWRYRPYLRDGKALPFQTVVIIDLQH